LRRPIQILLQTTIPYAADDWSIDRFSLLSAHLQTVEDGAGQPLFEVTARDRDALPAPDQVLSALDELHFDQIWLFAVDVGNGLTAADCDGISRFRARGGGLVVARDHMDLGSSVCLLDGIGAAHHFHTHNVDPDAVPEVDDTFTPSILWPNFHSGANGDFQTIDVKAPIHPVLVNPRSPGGSIRYLPSHPHEGAVSAPAGQDARVIATGRSQTTARSFNLAVAFEPQNGRGRAIAQSTFHHFADYNWDPSFGAPSFVTEPVGNGLSLDPVAKSDVYCYARNIALWLARIPIPSNIPERE
jgi:hypothetical protein